jgi:hypothetical protein
VILTARGTADCVRVCGAPDELFEPGAAIVARILKDGHENSFLGTLLSSSERLSQVDLLTMRSLEDG